MSTPPDSLFDKLPPHARDAERAVIAAMFVDAACIDDVTAVVRAGDFFFDGHAKTFRALVDLHDNGRPSDLVAVREELRSRGHLEDVGGDEFLAGVFDAVPTAANAEHHAAIVRETATRRRVRQLGLEMVGEADAGRMPAEELVAEAEAKLFDLSRTSARDATTYVRPVVAEELIRLYAMGGEGADSGISTGFQRLDDLTGGWQEGVYVVGARPSVGKSAFMLAAALTAVKAGVPTLMFSLEMSRHELVRRHLSMTSGVNLKKLRGGARLSAADAAEITPAAEMLCRTPLLLNDAAALTPAQFLSTTRRFVRKAGVRLVFIDYVQLMEPDGRRSGANRVEQVGSVTRAVKAAAKTLGLPVVCLAQLNRAVEGRDAEKPKLSDLRESGSIEQDADDVYLMWRVEAEPSADVWTIGLDVAKQRNGPTGEMRLAYRRSCARFEDCYPGVIPQ